MRTRWRSRLTNTRNEEEMLATDVEKNGVASMYYLRKSLDLAGKDTENIKMGDEDKEAAGSEGRKEKKGGEKTRYKEREGTLGWGYEGKEDREDRE